MITRHGWTAIVAAVASFVIGRVFGLIELYVVGVGIVIALLVAVMSVQRRLPPLNVKRIVSPSMVSVGEPARVDIQLANYGRQASPYLQLWEPVGNNGGAPMQLAKLAPGHAASAAYRVPTARRGLIRTGPLRALRRDVLGLTQRTTTLTGTEEVLIVPHTIPLPFPSVGSSGRLGQHLRMKSWGQTGTEFHSLREYQRGDDIRRINWKASARSTSSLIVRETALEGIRRCTVVLDTTASEYTGSSFEQAVIAAASITASAAHTGVNTRFVTNDVDLRGPDVAANALRWLAMVEPATEPPEMISINNGMSEGMGLLVIVTGSASSAAAGQLRSSANQDETLVIVCAREYAPEQSLHRRCHLDRDDGRVVDGADRRGQSAGSVVTAATAPRIDTTRRSRPAGRRAAACHRRTDAADGRHRGQHVPRLPRLGVPAADAGRVRRCPCGDVPAADDEGRCMAGAADGPRCVGAADRFDLLPRLDAVRNPDERHHRTVPHQHAAGVAAVPAGGLARTQRGKFCDRRHHRARPLCVACRLVRVPGVRAGRGCCTRRLSCSSSRRRSASTATEFSVAALWVGAAILTIAALRMAHARDDSAWMGKRRQSLWASLPAAVACALFATTGAVAVAPQLPGAGAKALLDTRNRSGDVTEVVSPLVDIRSRLVNRGNVELFTVSTNEPRYLGLSALGKFDGRRWSTLPEDTRVADGTLSEPPPNAEFLLQQITIRRLRGLLAPAARTAMSASWQGRTMSWANDAGALYVQDGLESNYRYQVTSASYEPTDAELRTTTVDRAPNPLYYAVPNLPDEVENLAFQVTAQATTPYDKARALQDFFRTQFEYSTTVQSGHSNDAMLNFLNIRKGYCEQFSGTFAAMARVVGLPTRVMVGFTQGQLRPDGLYHVAGRHAHAWDEVWFDGYGWVLFEPTPGRGAPGSEQHTGVAAAQEDAQRDYRWYPVGRCPATVVRPGHPADRPEGPRGHRPDDSP